MPRAHSIKQREHGNTLVESLIAVILTAVVGVGMTFTLTRAAVGQAKLNAQSQVVNQLRSVMLTQGMNATCANATASSGKSSAQHDNSGNGNNSNGNGNSDGSKGKSDSSGTTLTVGSTTVQANLQCTFQQLTVSVGTTTKSVLVPTLAYAVSDSRLGDRSLLLQNAGTQ